jgi:hypothetical protein
MKRTAGHCEPHSATVKATRDSFRELCVSDDLVPQEPSKTRRQRGPMAHTPEEILALSSMCDSDAMTGDAFKVAHRDHPKVHVRRNRRATQRGSIIRLAHRFEPRVEVGLIESSFNFR